MNIPWLWLPVAAVIALLIGGVVGYYTRQVLTKDTQQKLRDDAEHILNTAKEQALAVELAAKDKALELRQAGKSEIVRRRAELSREEDRLQKRREELDGRTDRLEKREQTLNKRQSFMDKRANDIEKLYEQEMAELTRVSQMTTEEARGVLLAEVEKDSAERYGSYYPPDRS